MARSSSAGPSPASTTYTDPFGDGTARSYDVGTWTSPVVDVSYPIDQAISSWNAVTPTGTWVETSFRGRYPDGTWSKWYVLGRWTSGMDYAAGDIHRTSLNGQGDTDGTVLTDTFASRKKRQPVAFQTRVGLLRPAGTSTSPRLDAVTTMSSSAYPDKHKATSQFTLGHQVSRGPAVRPEHPLGRVPGVRRRRRGVVLADVERDGDGLLRSLPERGRAGRSRTPTRRSTTPHSTSGTSPTTERELAVQRGVRPHLRTGRLRDPLRSLAEVERFVAAGIPVVVSLSWKLGDMPEAGYETNGHLLVIIGFTADGDPILNDPAANSNDNVRSIYTRENFEKVWQESTGGVSYVYHPTARPCPRTCREPRPTGSRQPAAKKVCEPLTRSAVPRI